MVIDDPEVAQWAVGLVVALFGAFFLGWMIGYLGQKQAFNN